MGASCATVQCKHMMATGGDRASWGALLEVELGLIDPNPLQPRRHMDEAALEELAASVQAHGILQPLVVSHWPAGTSLPASEPSSLPDGDVQPLDSAGPSGALPRYVLIAGHRRWEAARRAGLVRVPVVLREVAPRERLELALVENVQRADLHPLEEAAAYQHLAGAFGLTHEEIGQRVGKSRVAVSNTLRLLQLPAAIQQALLDGLLTEGHARAILGAPVAAQPDIAEQVVRHGLSVRQTEALVRRLLEVPARRASALPDSGDEIEARFRDALGTRVSLNRSKRGGRLVIYYFDDEQLQSIYERLVPDE